MAHSHDHGHQHGKGQTKGRLLDHYLSEFYDHCGGINRRDNPEYWTSTTCTSGAPIGAVRRACRKPMWVSTD